jgi:predicted membrane GTPase involved in stress response
MADGRVTAYALNDLQARGTLFVKEGDRVYPGMVVGESSTDATLKARCNPPRSRKCDMLLWQLNRAMYCHDSSIARNELVM